MITTLRSLDFFAQIPPELLTEIAGFARLLHLSPGEKLFATDDGWGHDIFILVEGELDVVAIYPGRKTDREMLLAPVDQEVFGEVGWLLKTKRTAVVRCRSAAKILRIDGDRLDRLLEHHPQVGYLLMRRLTAQLARKLIHTDQMVRLLLQNAIF